MGNDTEFENLTKEVNEMSDVAESATAALTGVSARFLEALAKDGIRTGAAVDLAKKLDTVANTLAAAVANVPA